MKRAQRPHARLPAIFPNYSVPSPARTYDVFRARASGQQVKGVKARTAAWIPRETEMRSFPNTKLKYNKLMKISANNVRVIG